MLIESDNIKRAVEALQREAQDPPLRYSVEYHSAIRAVLAAIEAEVYLTGVKFHNALPKATNPTKDYSTEL